MVFVIVSVRFFDYDYAHEQESGNPGAKAKECLKWTPVIDV